MSWGKFFLKFTGKQWEVKSALEDLEISQLWPFSSPSRNQGFKAAALTWCLNMKSRGPQGSGWEG